MSPYLLAYPVRGLVLASPIVIAAIGLAQAACYNSRSNFRLVRSRNSWPTGAAAIQISAWRRADDLNDPGFGRVRSEHASACP